MSSKKTVPVRDVAELGEVVAAVRIAQGLRADEFPVSHVFISELERGKATAQIGKVLEVLDALGIRVTLEMPPGMDIPVELGQKRRRISR